MGLCEKHLRDSESGMEIECDLRELFAELLEIPLDSFNEKTGGIPRRLFAVMLSRYRKKNAQISRECAIPEDEEEEVRACPPGPPPAAAPRMRKTRRGSSRLRVGGVLAARVTTA